MTLRNLFPRLATGAYILNSGLSKRDVDEDTAAGLHGMAAGAYPFLKNMDSEQFAKMLSTGEIAVGTMLLVPFVPSGLAGAALTGFAGALAGLYMRMPDWRQEGSVRPSQQGIPFAKDVWMLGIGLGMLAEALVSNKRE